VHTGVWVGRREGKNHLEDLGIDGRVILNWVVKMWGDRGGTVIKVLCYKSEGRWFDSRWCHWNFSLT
jgi:hypothetical protein